MKRTSMYLLILTAGCITAYINFSYDNNIEGIAPNTYVQSVSMRDLIEKANEDSEGDKTEVLVAKKENPIEQDKTFDNKQEEIIPLIVESLEESRVEKEISTEQIITIDEADTIAEEVIEQNQAEEKEIAQDLELEQAVEQKIEYAATRSVDTRNVSSNSLNSYVLDIIKTYKIGNYPYLLNTDYSNYNGVTENLFYNGEILLKAEPSGSKASHCSGITFEVFFKAMKQRNADMGLSDSINGMTKDDLYDMALTWYAAKGAKSQYNVATAVEKYNLGYRIKDMESLRAGDFIDFSRLNNTGHTAVFLNWIRDNNNQIVGFKYWSSQESTKGINYNEEYFNILDSNGKRYGSVMMDNFYMARIVPK